MASQSLTEQQPKERRSVLFHLSRLAAGIAAVSAATRSFKGSHREPAQLRDVVPESLRSAYEDRVAAVSNGRTPGATSTAKSHIDPIETHDASRETTADEAATHHTRRQPDAACDSRAADEPTKVDGGFVALAKELYGRFNQDDGYTRAAALAFFGVLSIVPVLLFALAALGFFIHDPRQAADYVHQIVSDLLPGAQASRAADQVIQQTNIVAAAQGLMRGRVWTVTLGILSLVWTAISLFVNATAPMNAAWDVQETRGFVKLRAICLGVFLGAGALFVLSLLPSSGPSLVRHLHIPGLGLPAPVPIWVDAAFLAVAWAIDIAMFVLIYRFLPNTKVAWRSALVGGAIAGVLWEIFKKAFATYLAHFGNFNKIYGALGGVVLLVTWIYYSCALLLAGAIICKMYQEHRSGGVKRACANTANRKPGAANAG